MKIARYTLLFVLALTVFACKQANQKAAKQKHQNSIKAPAGIKTDDEAAKLILDLEEVKRKDAIVRKGSKSKRHLSVYVETPPTTADPNYWVKVAEDNGGSYVTYYSFAVNSKTRQISYYDVIQDAVIPLAQWRKTTPANER